ncbi:MAG: Nif3-like dinuclear metal center hexameric protein, partial [Planctomycetaceae bacterium]|nr:Nif3-like dinuclear metal center hexameric protein [Planctomycetaceae bacterium]
MPSLSDVLKSLADLAPLELAEEWDNVGLLVGRTGESVERVMTCLTLTPDVAEEAIAEQIDMIVSHHPLMFRPRQTITFDSAEGALLIKLIQADIAVYSPHTAYDSAKEGINAQLAERLGLQNVVPIRPLAPDLGERSPQLAGLGSGRMGQLPEPLLLSELTKLVGERLPSDAGIQFVGDPEQSISKLAIACGSAAEFQGDARRQGADALITGEARFHACLEVRTHGPGLLISGHSATARPACL